MNYSTLSSTERSQRAMHSRAGRVTGTRGRHHFATLSSKLRVSAQVWESVWRRESRRRGRATFCDRWCRDGSGRLGSWQVSLMSMTIIIMTLRMKRQRGSTQATFLSVLLEFARALTTSMYAFSLGSGVVENHRAKKYHPIYEQMSN